MEVIVINGPLMDSMIYISLHECNRGVVKQRNFRILTHWLWAEKLSMVNCKEISPLMGRQDLTGPFPLLYWFQSSQDWHCVPQAVAAPNAAISIIASYSPPDTPRQELLSPPELTLLNQATPQTLIKRNKYSTSGETTKLTICPATKKASISLCVDLCSSLRHQELVCIPKCYWYTSLCCSCHVTKLMWNYLGSERWNYIGMHFCFHIKTETHLEDSAFQKKLRSKFIS